MSMTSTDTPGVAVPVARHAGIDTAGLAEKVAIRNLEFFYGDGQALKGISLSLYANKATAFIGPSGCGKSTLLRVLNRIYDLYPGQRATGEVLFDGENILRADQDLNLLRARIGMVFQKPTPFPDVDLRQHRLRHPALRAACRAPSSTTASRRRCAAPRCGTRSRTSCSQAASACRAASSSGSASPAPSR